MLECPTILFQSIKEANQAFIIRTNIQTLQTKNIYIYCWGLVLKCYELRTRQHKNRLMVNVLRPSKHYFPKDIKGVPSSSQYISMKDEAYETWEITWIII
jgi:hypothetical protein